MEPTPVARHFRSVIGRAVREGRLAIGWSQKELSRAAGLSTGMVAAVELGSVNVTVDTSGRLLSMLGLAVELRIDTPFADPRPRDAGHARSVAHVQRRLEAAGWLVQREVEVVHARSHGWIDVLAFQPATGILLVIEVKTEIHDLGRIERTLGWYGREAWRVAQRLGWRPRTIRPWLLILASEANDERIHDNREPLAQSFPSRGMDMLDPASRRPGLALIDPRSHRREWLMQARSDGRRRPVPYRDYAHFIRGRGR